MDPWRAAFWLLETCEFFGLPSYPTQLPLPGAPERFFAFAGVHALWTSFMPKGQSCSFILILLFQVFLSVFFVNLQVLLLIQLFLGS
jgi:hypothetical protein